jgi:hypothetical protein
MDNTITPPDVQGWLTEMTGAGYWVGLQLQHKDAKMPYACVVVRAEHDLRGSLETGAVPVWYPFEGESIVQAVAKAVVWVKGGAREVTGFGEPGDQC